MSNRRTATGEHKQKAFAPFKSFEPFRLASGEICCSDPNALCDACESKHAARTHRSASARVTDHTPPDPYFNDVSKLRAANIRAEGGRDLATLRNESDSTDPYAIDTERLRAEYRQ
jgi:hypothetical protein